MHIYQTPDGPIAHIRDSWRTLELDSWDDIFTAPSPTTLVQACIGDQCAPPTVILPPIGSQEVWASGVTYFRSRTARMEESEEAGGADFYDKVYHADRPELFFKSTAARVVGPTGHVRIRPDSTWDVPEPELTLAIHTDGRIIGYTIGNDMSSRSIEGENPLYLPQAKVYDGACALGPCLYLSSTPLPASTEIELSITRDGTVIFEGRTALDQMKRGPAELADWLCRELTFATGAYLLTGTGIVPDNDITLQAHDETRIRIAPIGELVNVVAAH